MPTRTRGTLAGVAVLVFSFAWFSCSGPEEQSGAKTTATSGGDVASIQILGVNDFEGRLEPTVEDGRKVGGAAYLAAYLDKYARESRSIVYRVDPTTLEATEVFRFPDHIGGVLRNTQENTLHGVSWGSRHLYRWTLDDSLEAKDADRPPEELSTPNRQHYIDYQDCQYLGNGMALCSGVVVYETPKDPEFYFGGIDLVNLQDNVPAHQIPVTLWTEDGLVMTHNPFFVEERDGGLRFNFMPEDDDSRLIIYET